MQTIEDIRLKFLRKYTNNDIISRNGTEIVELVGESFKANEDTIFGELKTSYIEKEIKWYESQSLHVQDIEGATPEIWKMVSSNNGEINSNYGFIIFNEKNNYQYNKVLNELLNNLNSRRAVMIYTNPYMHEQYKRDDMNDFVCTNTVQYLYNPNNNSLDVIVNMRSNDVYFGYRNDFAWQKYVLNKLVNQYNEQNLPHDEFYIRPGDIYWQVGSLHLYSRHFYILDKIINKKEVYR